MIYQVEGKNGARRRQGKCVALRITNRRDNLHKAKTQRKYYSFRDEEFYHSYRESPHMMDVQRHAKGARTPIPKKPMGVDLR
jgi:hypothetical protein